MLPSIRYSALGVRRWAFSSSRVTVFNLRQLPRQLHLRVAGRATFRAFSVTLAHEFHHVGQCRAGEKNLIHAALLHDALIVVGDRAAAAAENADVIGAPLFQLLHGFGEELDVTAVVTRYPHGGDVLLDRRADDVADVAMETEIDHLDSMPDELEIDRINGAIVPVADRDSSQDANRRGHEAQNLTAIPCQAKRFQPNVAGCAPPEPSQLRDSS